MDDRKEAKHDRKPNEAAGDKPPPRGRPRVQFRWMNWHDLPEVIGIENRTSNRAWSEHAFLSALRRRDCWLTVAELGGRVVGFMVYELQKDKLRLLSIKVDPEYQLRGVGRYMIKRLTDKLMRQHGRALELTVDERDLGAQKFFQACGFKATSIERPHVGETGDVAYNMRFSVDGVKAIGPERFAGRPRFTTQDFEQQDR